MHSGAAAVNAESRLRSQAELMVCTDEATSEVKILQLVCSTLQGGVGNEDCTDSKPCKLAHGGQRKS